MNQIKMMASCRRKIFNPIILLNIITFTGGLQLSLNLSWLAQKNTPDVRLDHPGYKINFRRRPTLPLSLPSSTIGAKELNFRVRDGNGCFLFAIATEKIDFSMLTIWIYAKKSQPDYANYFAAKPHDRLVPVS